MAEPRPAMTKALERLRTHGRYPEPTCTAQPIIDYRADLALVALPVLLLGGVIGGWLALRRNKKMADAAEMLWVVLANVSGGDWEKQSAEWQEAAARWRDNYSAASPCRALVGWLRRAR